jgi:hypothetical protein
LQERVGIADATTRHRRCNDSNVDGGENRRDERASRTRAQGVPESLVFPQAAYWPVLDAGDQAHDGLRRSSTFVRRHRPDHDDDDYDGNNQQAHDPAQVKTHATSPHETRPIRHFNAVLHG